MKNFQHQPFKPHHPPHLVSESGVYFITCRCRDRKWFLRPDKYKEILLNSINLGTKKLNIQLLAFAILPNHYHLLITLPENQNLSNFIRFVNGRSARLLNDEDSSIFQKIWNNYFDKGIRSEKDFYTHLNYIHQNPIKHGVVKSFAELLGYRFCSYAEWVEKKGKEVVEDSFARYPVIDFLHFVKDDPDF